MTKTGKKSKDQRYVGVSGPCQNGHHKRSAVPLRERSHNGRTAVVSMVSGSAAHHSHPWMLRERRRPGVAFGPCCQGLSAEAGRLSSICPSNLMAVKGTGCLEGSWLCPGGFFFFIPFACHAQTCLHHRTGRCKMDISSAPCSSLPNLELPILLISAPQLL